MLSSTFPYPPSQGGTEVRTFNLLKYLKQRHSITLVTQPHPTLVPETSIAALRTYVDQLVMFPLPLVSPDQEASVWGKVGRFCQSWLQQTPPNVLHCYSPEIQAWVDQHVQAGEFDIITCEHSINEAYIRPETQKIVPTVVDIHSSVYAWTRNHLEMGASEYALRDRLHLPMLYRYEKRYCSKFSQLVVTTPDDAAQMRQFNNQVPIAIIPNGVDLELFPYRKSDPGGHHLVFVGAMDASHNIDAVRFFVLEVLPKLQARYPDTQLSIVGSRPVPEVEALAEQPGVIVTGRVPSMVDYLHQATVCVIPLRTGFGIKNKTLEAMAAGTPVVGSDRGLEGLAVDSPDVPLRALRANQVEEYIAAISQLFEDADLRDRLSANGRHLVETEYTWEQAGQQYEQALLTMTQTHTPAKSLGSTVQV